ncbi:MAG TPA: peptide deformylase [Peptococcaceae bacterium]|jgi:peptide deformylase|nr:peptide deformylase [Clostridia bacterium]HOB81949.1 peptide deformylase [Peptococcaceae bacterium]HQD53267.1 peptide deformylase [Peptococcaceae bacterium]
MAVYQIVETGDEILRMPAKKIEKITPNVGKLLDNLRDTLEASETGVGLAAPQIGISKRAIVVSYEEEYYELINPEIVSKEGEDTDTEGCLSVPGVLGEVTRAVKVQVVGLNRQGEEVKIKAEGFLARIFQHEIDHLEGILFIDRAEKIRRVE